MDDKPDSTYNHWNPFGEPDPTTFRAKMKKRYEQAVLNPDPQIVEGSKWMSGIVLGAISIALAILIVAGAMALAIKFLS